jgi:potassium channel subfamily K
MMFCITSTAYLLPLTAVFLLYTQVVTFTSVGYGDLCPTTLGGKLFTILFGLSGIALLGAAIATIGSRIVERENQMIQAAKEASRKRMVGLFQALHVNVGESKEQQQQQQQQQVKKTSLPSPDAVAARTQLQEASQKLAGVLPIVPLWRHTIGNLVKKSIPAIFALMVGGTLMGRIEGWCVTDSIYYAFITAGTLGYGDFSPLTRRGRIWGIVFIPLAVAAAGEVLGNVASVLLERRQEQVYETLMKRELDIKQLLEMDTDNDGLVSREEYVEFMLKEMELVPQEQFDELHAQFERLDADGGGFLDKNDLKLKQAKIEPEGP